MNEMRMILPRLVAREKAIAHQMAVKWPSNEMVAKIRSITHKSLGLYVPRSPGIYFEEAFSQVRDEE